MLGVWLFSFKSLTICQRIALKARSCLAWALCHLSGTSLCTLNLATQTPSNFSSPTFWILGTRMASDTCKYARPDICLRNSFTTCFKAMSEHFYFSKPRLRLQRRGRSESWLRTIWIAHQGQDQTWLSSCGLWCPPLQDEASRVCSEHDYRQLRYYLLCHPSSLFLASSIWLESRRSKSVQLSHQSSSQDFQEWTPECDSSLLAWWSQAIIVDSKESG